MKNRRKLVDSVICVVDDILNEKKQILKEAYKEANNDFDRLKTIQEWEVLEKED